MFFVKIRTSPPCSPGGSPPLWQSAPAPPPCPPALPHFNASVPLPSRLHPLTGPPGPCPTSSPHWSPRALSYFIPSLIPPARRSPLLLRSAVPPAGVVGCEGEAARRGEQRAAAGPAPGWRGRPGARGAGSSWGGALATPRGCRGAAAGCTAGGTARCATTCAADFSAGATSAECSNRRFPSHHQHQTDLPDQKTKTAQYVLKPENTTVP